MKYEELINTAETVHILKGQDYASPLDKHSNFKFADSFASLFPAPSLPYATLVGVKFARLQTLLASRNSPNFESISDTFVDLINYIALWGERVTEKE
jgi:hypothetical protein